MAAQDLDRAVRGAAVLDDVLVVRVGLCLDRPDGVLDEADWLRVGVTIETSGVGAERIWG